MTFSYVNGRFFPESEAMISVKDRGLKFGDGVFETIVVHGGKPYQWDLHIKRLQQSLAAIVLPFSEVFGLHAIAMELLKRNECHEAVLRITITRGIGGRAYAAPLEITPSVILETFPYPLFPEKPIMLYQPSWKKISPACLPIHVKTLQCLNSVLARTEAERHGCFEALLLNEKEQVCECSSANIFWFKGETLFTPAKEVGILGGTTRHAVMRLSPYNVIEGVYTLEDLLTADEVFLSNVTLKAQAVGGIQGIDVTWAHHPKTAIIRQLIMDDIQKMHA